MNYSTYSTFLESIFNVCVQLFYSLGDIQSARRQGGREARRQEIYCVITWTKKVLQNVAFRVPGGKEAKKQAPCPVHIAWS